jgi:hypothetical protein
MRNLIILLILLFNVCDVVAQPFTYSGWVRGANEQGLSNVPVTLWGRRTDPYDITYPSYSTATPYTNGTPIPSSDDATHGPFNIGFTFNFFGNSMLGRMVGLVLVQVKLQDMLLNTYQMVLVQ